MVVVLMGVAGAGKTTVGRRLAQELGWTYYEGDDFHPPSNIEKMARGKPLNDADRDPWLDALHELVQDLLRRGENAVLACSALKRRYRKRLLVHRDSVRLVYLQGTREVLHRRIESRGGHFMSVDLLESQFEALEEPDASEGALWVDVSGSMGETTRAIRDRLGL